MGMFGSKMAAGGDTPLDGLSAGLSLLGTYLVCMYELLVPKTAWIRRKTKFVCLFLLLPFHHPSTTPLLSP